MVGEDAHRAGEDGTRRAKLWLASTTRVLKTWTHGDAVPTSRLSFSWPHGGQSFSYDIGGTLQGQPFDGHLFLAECKNYKAAQDQGTHYDKFLAQSYVVASQGLLFADHFMWITWAPFRADSWDKQVTKQAVIDALLHKNNIPRVFGDDTTKEDARTLIDESLADDVASRIWIIVLSEKMEQLVISRDHRSWLIGEMVRREEY